jgi:hypothetical protein
MNSFFKTPLLFAILGLAFHPQPAFAGTSSDSSSTAPAQNPKTSAKSADQPDAKTSAATTRSDSSKEPSVSGKEDSASPDPVAAPQGPALFKLIDTDKNGRISLAEFVAYGTAAEAHSTGPVKTSPSENTRSDSPSGSTSSSASTKRDAAKTAHSDDKPAAKREPASPDADILTSTDTRAGRYTAGVFDILDINHDKFLTQAELDALIPAHEISQP